jgi:hypothetical protein
LQRWLHEAALEAARPWLLLLQQTRLTAEVLDG